MSHPRITAAEAHEKMREHGYVYIDVRTEDEVDAGHPTGAFHVPVRLRTDLGMEPNGDFVAVVSAVFEKDSKLIVGCKAGPRSLAAAQLLTAAGFTDVLEQRAGFSGARDAFGTLVDTGWQAAGLPCASELEAGHSYDELRERAGLGSSE
jgi:rhodanese-related sulfurtransferase